MRLIEILKSAAWWIVMSYYVFQYCTCHIIYYFSFMDSNHTFLFLDLIVVFYSFIHFALWRRKWQPTPVFLPGKSHGGRSLVGYCPWGRKESDMTEWREGRCCFSILSYLGSPIFFYCVEYKYRFQFTNFLSIFFYAVMNMLFILNIKH